MPTEKLLIANQQVGLETDVTQWLIPDDAFPEMEDFFIFRGRVLSRKGYRGIGRLIEESSAAFPAISALAPSTYSNTVASTVEPGTFELFLYDSSGPPPTLVRTYLDRGSGGLQNVSEASFAISNITNANPPQVTTTVAHGFATGDVIFFDNVVGLENITTGVSGVNEQAFVITVLGANDFTLNGQDFSTNYTAYDSEGTCARGAIVNYTTGAFTLSWGAIGGVTPYNLIAHYMVDDSFPCRPVMGIKERELPEINAEQTIAFDPRKANYYDGTAFNDITYYKNSGTAFNWNGDNSQFFSTNNYANAFWATNFVPGLHASATASSAGDGIRWFDGTTLFVEGWVNFNPSITATDRLLGARHIVPYYGRLVVLNTFEGTVSPGNAFPQRARWCQIGTPYPATDPSAVAYPLPSNFSGAGDDLAWRSDIAGRGGFVDAPTSQYIIGYGWYKDQLIVFFEESTWALLYTGNSLLPFTWERINSELGCESPNAPIQFDGGILAVGNRGIISAGGNQVKRIDEKIPDEVFNFKNDQEGHLRVQGIRDYFNELVYWTVPEAEFNSEFPNKLLVYNYRSNAFSFFRDSFTALGYIQFSEGYIWDKTDVNWEDADWRWDDPATQSLFSNICAGNNMGYIFALNIQNENDPSMDIITWNTALGFDEIQVTTCNNHNLQTNDYVKFSDVTGLTLAGVASNLGTAPANSTSFEGRITDLAIVPGSVTITIGANVFTDPGADNILVPGNGSIDYESGRFTVNYASLGAATAVTSTHTQTINGKVVSVIGINDTVVQLDFDFTGWGAPGAGTGEMAFVNRPLLRSKRLNPYIADDRNVKFVTTDWYTDNTPSGEYICNVLYDDVPETITDGQSFVVNTKPEDNVGLGNLNQFSERLWHRMPMNSSGSFLQLEVTLSDDQMIDTDVNTQDINIHAILIRYEPDSRLVQ